MQYNNIYQTETPYIIQQSMINAWYDASVPSSSIPKHLNYSQLRDEYNKQQSNKNK